MKLVFLLICLCVFILISILMRDNITYSFIINYYEIFNNFISKNYYISILLFFLIYILWIIFLIPMISILSLTSGLLFGVSVGVIISLSAITIGSFFIFILSNYFYKNLLHNKISKFILKASNMFKNNEIEFLFLIRLIPGVPFFLQNILLAILGANRKKFVLSTIIGMFPIIYTLVTIGSNINQLMDYENSLGLKILLNPTYYLPLLLIIILYIISKFYKRFNFQ